MNMQLFWRPLRPLQFYLHLNNPDVTLYEADSINVGRVYKEGTSLCRN